MTSTELHTEIEKWTHWAEIDGNGRYDIALFKIWIQFERFLSELFRTYTLGGNSEAGYCPERMITFQDETQLNAFIKSENRTYVDYLPVIERLSKYIFRSDPFSKIIFEHAIYHQDYLGLMAIRNYIAHESGESKKKLIRQCFGNLEENFKEPNDYLRTIKRGTGKSYYSYYIEVIENIVEYLIKPFDDEQEQ